MNFVLLMNHPEQPGNGRHAEQEGEPEDIFQWVPDDLLPRLGAGDADLGASGVRWDTLYATAANLSGDLSLTGGDITGANSEAIDIGEATNDEIQFSLGGNVEFSFALDTGNPAIQITDAKP